MKIARKVLEESESIQMAPLIDIVFLTLVFFMATAVYAALESEVDITLPTADSAVQSERAQGEIAGEREQVAGELRRQVADLSIGVAEKVVGDSLDDERQRELVDRYIDDLGGVH